MALFQGEDLVDVPMPDGRTLKLPRSAVPASALPQVAQAPAGFTDETAYNVNPAIAPVTSGAPQTDENGVIITPQQAASASKEKLANMGAPIADALTSTGAQVAGAAGAAGQQAQDIVEKAPTTAQLKQKAQQDAFNASPKGQLAQANKAQKDAYASEIDHVNSAAELDAAGQDIIANAYDERNQNLDKLFAEREAEARKNAETEQAKMDEVTDMRKRIEGTRINRKADHPILAAIAIALGGLGSAMKHEDSNPALEVFWKAIDRKVNAQMQDLDKLRSEYGMSKDDLQMFKDKSDRKLQLYNTLLAGEADKAAKHIEALGARMQGEKTRAAAKIAADQIRQKAAEHALEAVRWGLDYDMKEKQHKDQMSLGWANYAEGRRSNMSNEQIRREGQYLDYQQALATAKASGDAAQYKQMMELQKENESRGIGNVATGEPLLTQKGIEAMHQADAYEQKAAQIEQDAKTGLFGIPTPEVMQSAASRAQMYRDKASEIRGTARTLYQFRARDPVEARDLGAKYGASQSVMDAIDDIKLMYKNEGRSLFGTPVGRAKLQAAFNGLQPLLKNSMQLGAWDKGSKQLVQEVIGKDPSGWDTDTVLGELTNALIGTDPQAFEGRLDQLAKSVRGDMYNQLRQAKWDVQKPEELFVRRSAQQESPEGKALEGISKGQSPVAAEAAAEPSTAGKVRDTIFSAVTPGSDPQYKVNQKAAQESGSVQYPGMGANQEQGFDSALKMYKSGNQRIGPMLVAQATEMAKTRPDDAIGMLHALRDNAPKLYEQAAAALPEGAVKTQLDAEVKTRAAVSDTPTDMLAQNVLMTMDQNGKITDQDGYFEIVRRAQTTGPGAAAAKKAYADILKQSGVKKMPPGSVFRGGL